MLIPRRIASNRQRAIKINLAVSITADGERAMIIRWLPMHEPRWGAAHKFRVCRSVSSSSRASCVNHADWILNCRHQQLALLFTFISTTRRTKSVSWWFRRCRKVDGHFPLGFPVPALDNRDRTALCYLKDETSSYRTAAKWVNVFDQCAR